jgi:N4-gp56 family major capsid protein
MQMEYRTKLARLAIEVKDDNTQLGMLGAAGVRFYAGTATSLDTVGQNDENALPTYNFFRKIAKRLKINLAEKNESMLTGSVKVGTTPINRAYYAIVGPDVVYDLEGIPEFRAVHEYGYASNLAQNEVGSIHETRFIETTRAMKYAGKGAIVTTNPGVQETDGHYDVFPILYPTKGSYATVSLAGAGAIKFKSKAPGKATSEDPYGVKGLFSYNTWFAGLALQPEKLLVAYVTASQ